MRKMVAY